MDSSTYSLIETETGCILRAVDELTRMRVPRREVRLTRQHTEFTWENREISGCPLGPS